MNEWRSWRTRSVSRRTVLRGAGVAGAGLAGAALLGCGEDDPAPATGTTAPGGATTTATGSAPAAGAAKPGGRMTLNQFGDPPSFDLHRESTTLTNYPTNMAYNQLMRFDPDVGDETPESVIEDLATEWEITPDGQTYTFHLRDGVQFSDGTPFAAADVKASYERQINPPESLSIAPRGAQMQWVDTIETPDDRTVVIRAMRPVSSLSIMPILAQSWMAIYSQKDIDGGLDFRAEINGTGPYVLGGYEPGSKVTMDRNPNYWAPDRPYLDGVDVFVVPDTSTAVSNFQGGQLHLIGVSVKDMENLQAALGDKITVQRGPSLNFTTMNYGGREPWTDIRVRQAVAMAHNKRASIDILAFGDANTGGYLAPGGYWSLSAEDIEGIPGYEPFTDQTVAEARKLLDAAGVPSTMDVTILTRQNSSEDASLYVQDQLAKLGLNATLDIQETASAYDIMAKREFDLGPWGHGVALDDPDAIFAEFYLNNAPRNYSAISTPEIDQLYLEQSQEQDPETRQDLVKQLQRDAMAIHGKTIIQWSRARELSWNTLHNYTLHNNIYNNRRWQDVWLDV